MKNSPLLQSLLLGAALAASAACSHAATLVDFDFTGNDGTQTSETGVVAAGLTATDLVRGAGLRTNGNATWSADGFNIRKISGESNTSSDTLTEAFSKNIYAGFSVTVQEGYSLDVSSLDFGWARQNNLNRSIALLVSVGDNVFAETDLVGTITSSTATLNAASATGHSFTLSSVAQLQGVVGTTVYFRLYVYGAQNSFETEALSDANGQVGLDLLGTVTASPVPEPSAAAALAGVAALAMVVYRRRA